VRREYTRVLNSRFVRVHNRSEYPPQGTNPKGEIHEDEGFISFDRAPKRPVFRQFHVEGFVNQYLEDADTSPSTVMFTTETIENIPAAGARVKRMWFMGPDEFEEVFELAESGKPFELYSRARLRRTR
jgi:hypothetical protein